jgi:hypothetical protein
VELYKSLDLEEEQQPTIKWRLRGEGTESKKRNDVFTVQNVKQRCV